MATQKLLPLNSPAQNSQPPVGFNLKLSKELQEKLSNHKGKLKIVVSGGEISLKFGDELIPLDQTKEQNKTHIYKQFSSSTFKSIGSIHSRLNPTQSTTQEQSKPVNQEQSKISKSNGSNQPKLSQSQISKKLFHILALGPITLQELHQQTKIPIQDIESNLRSISMIYTPRSSSQHIVKEYPRSIKDFNEQDRYFVLNYGHYKELKVSNFNDEESRKIRQNCKLVFDYLNYPPTHPARQLFKELNIPKEPKSSRMKNNSRESSVPKEEPKNNKVRNSRESSVPIREESQSAVAQPLKKPDPSRKRPRSKSPSQTTEDEEYYQNLAERFKLKYKEYKDLYKQIEVFKRKNGNKVDLEYKKLVELHKDLEIWKTQLWKSVQQ